MKKTKIIALALILLLIGGIFWLLSGADTKNLERTEVITDIQDNFEK